MSTTNRPAADLLRAAFERAESEWDAAYAAAYSPADVSAVHAAPEVIEAQRRTDEALVAWTAAVAS